MGCICIISFFLKIYKSIFNRLVLRRVCDRIIDLNNEKAVKMLLNWLNFLLKP